jgi:hypothetical protein
MHTWPTTANTKQNQHYTTCNTHNTSW